MMNLREWALPVYTILIQLATGALLGLWVIRILGVSKMTSAEMQRMVKHPILVILLTILVAMIGAHFHLSRPFLSYLAILNLGSSWLSREILFTILFFATVGALAALQWFGRYRPRLEMFLGWFSIGWGLASIYCMSKIYELATQAAWNSSLTTASFYTTTVLVGLMALVALLIMDLRFSQAQGEDDLRGRDRVVQIALVWIAVIAVVMAAGVFVLNLAQIWLLQAGNELAQTSLRLLLGLYGPLFAIRIIVVIAGVGWLGYATWDMKRRRRGGADLIVPVYLSFLLVLIGEILGRFLFYATHIRQGI